jgi:CRISPR-associated protein Csb1
MPEATLSFDHVLEALNRGAAGFRARTRLLPIGGSGDKVFPPTFGDEISMRIPEEQPDGSIAYRDLRTKYAVEDRRIEGQTRLCVLLDSVASQANRFEEALQRAWDESTLSFPMVRVDFTKETSDAPEEDLSTMGGDGYLTTLEAPHRLSDALLRDSLLDGVRFRASDVGRALTEAAPHNATAIYKHCPTALVFGMWDSTGPKGGQGAKFQRALVSEIVGVSVAFGRKSASRIDPAGIELQAGPIFMAKDDQEEWTLDAKAAATKNKQPIPFSRKGKADAGKPSTINHGNIAPSLDEIAGGVTVDYAEQITVLSLPALRRLRFPAALDGKLLESGARKEAETAARGALASLALAAVALQRVEGFDLRSRCAFVPDGPLRFQLVDRDGGEQGPFELSPENAAKLVESALARAKKHGFGWSGEAIDLTPAPKLVELIRRSRRVAARGDEE